MVGVGIFAVWVGISGEWTTQNSLWVKLGISHPPAKPAMSWNPNEQFGSGSALAWLFIVTRILGSTFVVPPLEEVFYRSFLYRYIARPGFFVRAVEPVFAVAVSGDRRRLRLFAQRMAGGHFMRRGLSMAGPPQKPAGRRDDGARHHEFSARRLDCVAGRVAFLVRNSFVCPRKLREKSRTRTRYDEEILLRLEVDVVAFERAAFLRGEVGERLVVIGERADFLRARGGQVVLIFSTSKVVALPTA